MGTNCVPLLADLFLYSHEADFIQRLLKKNEKKIARSFNFTFLASLIATTLYQGHPDRNHKLWNIVSFERYLLHMQVLLECCYL
jgi:hypothetical protein